MQLHHLVEEISEPTDFTSGTLVNTVVSATTYLKKEKLSWKNLRRILEGYLRTDVGIRGLIRLSLKDAIGGPLI